MALETVIIGLNNSMQMRGPILLLFYIFLNIPPTYAQQTLAVGQWDDFLPYKKGSWVTQSDDDIYFATEFSVMSLTKAELSPTFIGKLQGLSDVGIERIAYDKANDQLVIVYVNSNIDIYTDLNVTNISDIKDNKNIVGSKRITDIHLYDERSAFFATAFGIVELDLQTLDFGSTIFTEVAVNDISSRGNELYAATENGIYTVTIEPTTNIADFSRWRRLGEADGLFENYAAQWVELSGDNLYAVINDELLVSKAGANFEYSTDPIVSSEDIQFVSKGNENILVGFKSSNNSSKAVTIADDGTVKQVANGCINNVLYGIEDEEGRYWFADRWTNFRYTTAAGGCKTLSFNSPDEARVSDIALVNNEIYIATGGVDTENEYLSLSGFNFEGIYRFDGEEWSSLDGNSIPLIRDSTIYDMFQVETEPRTGHVFFGSFLQGLVDYDPATGEVIHYHQHNSDLQGVVGDAKRERVAGIAFDRDGTLWINNFGAPKPLVALDTEGEWHSFNVESGTKLAECVVDDNGYIWSIVVGGSGGVLVYDPKGRLADPTDHEQRVISSSNSELTAPATALAVDQDGQVWVGTEKGPVIFDGGSGIFDPANTGSVRKVLQDSILGILLQTEDIRAIEIDGANRKWFGTRNGIFVQSSDGEFQVAHYTVDNSPLFNNVIRELKFDGDKGIMYIGTDFGVQSLRTDTETARNTHSASVYAFPNPVRPDYEGEIYIKGLARDADVKITDLNGKLIYETQALGGLASWNGRDYNGRKAATGVYLVFSTGSQSFDTPDAFVTKILIVD